MGVTQSFYAPLARWLAGQGYLAITFDYRGIGESAPPTLRGFGATLTDWLAHVAEPDRDRREIAAIREREMREAAAVLGVNGVSFLGFTDGSLENGLELRRAITREVRRTRPDVIVTFDPSLEEAALDALLRPGSGVDYAVFCGSLYMLGEVIPLLARRYAGLEELGRLME
jgi:hypothetical protein